jgi:hypothetical protein
LKKSDSVRIGTDAKTCTPISCEIGSSQSPEFTIYTAKWCGSCRRFVPIIVKRIREAGLGVKLVDVDGLSIPELKLRRVQFVPHIDYLGREIDEDELDRLIRSKCEEVR